VGHSDVVAEFDHRKENIFIRSHARIAVISGLMPMMFITRVRLQASTLLMTLPDCLMH